MTLKPPTTFEIAELAEARTNQFFGPKDAPAGSSAENWARNREQAYARQTDAARAELTHRFEIARDREAAQEAARKSQVDEREAGLHRRFDTRFPGGSEADFATMRPTLMAELSDEAAQSEKVAYAESLRRIRI